MSKYICERLYAASYITSWENICSEDSETLCSLDSHLILFLLGTHKMYHIPHLNVPGHWYTKHQIGSCCFWLVWSNVGPPLIMWDYYALGRCLILHFYAAVGFLVYSSVNILCRANNFFQDALTLWLYSMCHKYSSVFLNHQLCVSFPWWSACSL